MMTCSVCDADLSTTRLCDACRADPANVDWLEDSDELHANPDRFSSTSPRLADLIDRPLRQPTVLYVRVLELMTLYVVKDAVRVRARLPGGGRGYVWRDRRRGLCFREIAFLLGCSKSYVARIYRDVVG